jgi:hypothetical protein
LGSSRKPGASTRDPEHAFDDQAVISGGATGLRLLRGQERRQMGPVLIGEYGQSRHRQGSRQESWQRRSLASTAPDMEVPGLCLVLASEA